MRGLCASHFPVALRTQGMANPSQLSAPALDQERTRSGDERKGKPEGGTFPRRTFHPDFSLVLRDQHLANIEAQTESLLGTTEDGHPLDLVKALPEVLLRFCREARSLVSHPDTSNTLLGGQPNMDGLIGT